MRSQSENKLGGDVVNLNADEGTTRPKTHLETHATIESTSTSHLMHNSNTNTNTTITTTSSNLHGIASANTPGRNAGNINEVARPVSGLLSTHNANAKPSIIHVPSTNSNGNEAEGQANIGDGSAAKLNGWVYHLDNGKWNKIGDMKTCTISMFGKSLKRGKYESPNGMMTLTSTQIDASVIVTHVFEFNASELQPKEENAWRIVVKEPNNNNRPATLAIRFKEKENSQLFETTYKWIMTTDINEQMKMRSMGLYHETQGGIGAGGGVGGTAAFAINTNTAGGTVIGGNNNYNQGAQDIALEMGIVKSHKENLSPPKINNQVVTDSESMDSDSDVSVDDMYAIEGEGT